MPIQAPCGRGVPDERGNGQAATVGSGQPVKAGTGNRTTSAPWHFPDNQPGSRQEGDEQRTALTFISTLESLCALLPAQNRKNSAKVHAPLARWHTIHTSRRK